MDRFHLNVREDAEGAYVIEVHGEVDLAVARPLGDAIAAVPAPAAVRIDLSACEFIDSTAIATVLLARRELAAAGRTLVLTGAGGQVLRLLQVAGLDRDGLLVASGDEIEIG
jgi:anti-sigma B factor antagonist